MRIKLSLLAALLLAAPTTARAQQLSFGVRGGLNIASADAKGDLFQQDVGTRTGFHGGILAAVDISKNFAIQTEVLYSQKGFGKGDGNVALSVDYFEIPVLAVVKLPTHASPHLYAGAVLGLESRCRVSNADTEADCEAVIIENLGLPRTRGADSGLLFGLGVTLDAGFADLLIDAMYNYGLTDISEPTDTIESIKTRTFYLSAGLIWSLGKSAG